MSVSASEGVKKLKRGEMSVLHLISGESRELQDFEYPRRKQRECL